jgi:serine/threonine protein phosphatase PrpC
VLFLLEHGKAWWAHCGDSRLYHFRGAKPVSRTHDHSLVGELMRKGRLDEAGSLIHPQRNVLLSCLGDTAAPHIEHGSAETLAAGDAFLLCSDGLWAYFTDFELASTIAKQAPREAASTLIRLARERGAGEGDNISLAVIKLV